MRRSKLFLGAVALAAAICAGQAHAAEDIKLGILLGYTGPIESLAGDMAEAAELAMREVTKSGALLDGSKVTGIRADSTCIDSAAATAAAERLVTSDRVDGIIGADCSGVTIAVLQNVALAKGVVMVSPSATSPALSTIRDNDLFFRTAPSDARQGQVITDILNDRGIGTIAITYTNNDYGKGLADSIERNFEESGGEVTISTSHEDGKADYGAEVGALAQAGGDILVVAGYLDQGGKGIIQASLDSGSFDTFFLPDGMIGDSLPAAIGPDLDGSIGTVPGTDSPGAKRMDALAASHGFKNGPFAAETYDAAALIMLAMQAAESTDSNRYKNELLKVANAPGEKIYPGEIAKGLRIIARGGEVDYVGASAVELVGAGESAGNYREIEVKGGENTTANFR